MEYFSSNPGPVTGSKTAEYNCEGIAQRGPLGWLDFAKFHRHITVKSLWGALISSHNLNNRLFRASQSYSGQTSQWSVSLLSSPLLLSRALLIYYQTAWIWFSIRPDLICLPALVQRVPVFRSESHSLKSSSLPIWCLYILAVRHDLLLSSPKDQ